MVLLLGMLTKDVDECQMFQKSLMRLSLLLPWTHPASTDHAVVFFRGQQYGR